MTSQPPIGGQPPRNQSGQSTGQPQQGRPAMAQRSPQRQNVQRPQALQRQQNKNAPNQKRNTPQQRPQKSGQKHPPSSDKKAKVDFLRGRLPWRIILAVFLTIAFVESAIIYFRMENIRAEVLEDVIERGRNAVMPIFDVNLLARAQQDPGILNAPPISNMRALRLIDTTLVTGISVFSVQTNQQIEVFGEPPILSPMFFDGDPKLASDPVTWTSPDLSRAEILIPPKSLDAPFIVAVRMDATEVDPRVQSFLVQTTVVVLLLAAFVTSVLILVLGKWLLEPILMLRENLMRAAHDPESPERYFTIYKNKDELGSVIASANRLIRQNAQNISRLNQQAHDKIYRLAYFDNLTDLPNRALFIQKLEEMLNPKGGLSRSSKVTIVAIDLDNFCDINDTLGYSFGDQALKLVGQRLVKNAPGNSVVARLGDDQFAIAVLGEPNDIEVAMRKLMSAFRLPFVMQKNDYVIEISLGMANFPQHSTQPEELLQKAETALEQTKQEQRGGMCWYTEDFEKSVLERIEMVRDLRIAIREHQFSLHYQPQVDAQTLDIVGAEALLRWERPNKDGTKTFIRPDIFIEVAEQSGLIIQIGRWVAYEACRFVKFCENNNLPAFRIAVNLSGVQVARDDVVSLTRKVLKDVGIEPKMFELEVTESAVMKDMNATIELLQNLRDLGIELAIDDFGTGYSSLAYLKKFPVHRLKIDRAFIMDVHKDRDDAAIAQTIINLGDALELKVLAEGVETPEHVAFLQQNGCEELQGYYFSKPLASNDFINFLRELPQKREEWSAAVNAAAVNAAVEKMGKTPVTPTPQETAQAEIPEYNDKGTSMDQF